MKKIAFSLLVCILWVLVAFSQEKDEDLYPFHSPVTGKIGFMNADDEIVVPPNYSFATGNNHWKATKYYVIGVGEKYSKEARYALIDNKGKFILDFKNEYEWIGERDAEYGFIEVKKNDKYGYVNLKNEIVIPLIYDFTGAYSQGLFAMQKNGKWGFTDSTGKTVIDFKFDGVGFFSEVQPDGNKYAEVDMNERSGFINEKGDIVIPCIYEFAYPFTDGFSRVTLNKKKGMIDTKGKVIIPIRFDDVHYSDLTRQFTARKNGKDEKYGYEYTYDPKGKLISKKRSSYY